jgi:type II secretory ATPase GspE/PulE/Tfp pilus assembly ATPase PilB-like protein
MNPSVPAKLGKNQPVSRGMGDPIEVTDPGSGRKIVVSGTILTTPNGPLGAADAIRKICVLTSTGQFIVSRSERKNVHLLSFEARARQLGKAVLEAELVDRNTIALIYEQAVKRGSIMERMQRDNTRMQRDVIELVAAGAAKNASDIHIHADLHRASLEFRLDGAITYEKEFDPQYAYDLMATAFAMADASDPSYQPFEVQGARISRMTTELPPAVQAVRLQWNPLVYNGRMLVMRLLYSKQKSTADIVSLGYSPHHLRHIRNLQSMPQGINIIAGPTGSGKSTTLKVAIDGLIASRNGEIKVLTVEDPPEYIIDGARQIPVMNTPDPDDRARMFQKVLSAALRSDPDALLIGEIRDKESAKLSFEGAMTGHQIWTSLHANTAMIILDRLRDMGVEWYKLTDPNIVTGLVGQRLVRMLCPNCRRPWKEVVDERSVDEDAVSRLDDFLDRLGRGGEIFHRGEGCSHPGCKNGYVGRSVVAEIIRPDQDFMDLIKIEKKVAAEERWTSEAMNGMTMLTHGMIKVLRGEISPIDLEFGVGLIAHKPYMDRWLARTDL